MPRLSEADVLTELELKICRTCALPFPDDLCGFPRKGKDCRECYRRKINDGVQRYWAAKRLESPHKEEIQAVRVTEFVYFIQEENGPIKIGRARNPLQRLRQLQTGNLRPLRLIAFTEGDSRLESSLHFLFRRHKIAREWYHPAPEMEALLCSESRWTRQTSIVLS